MKKLTQIALMAFGMFAMVSCGDQAANTSQSNPENDKMNNTNRGLYEMVDFKGETARLNKATDIITISAKKMQEDDDAAAVSALGANFAVAESTQALDIAFEAEEGPVENGMYIFSIESDDTKQLVMEMYDEEGFAMAANNTIDINSGKNYKALNVQALDDGTYTFRLKNDLEGGELNRKLEIKNN